MGRPKGYQVREETLIKWKASMNQRTDEQKEETKRRLRRSRANRTPEQIAATSRKLEATVARRAAVRQEEKRIARQKRKELSKRADLTGLSAEDKRKYQLHRLVYNAMKFRCYNKKCTQFNDYGGRGIIVCDRWLESFDNFIADMGYRPDGYTLDRIDNNGNYEPSNCKWASREEQQRNTRVYRGLTHEEYKADQLKRYYLRRYQMWVNEARSSAPVAGASTILAHYGAI